MTAKTGKEIRADIKEKYSSYDYYDIDQLKYIIKNKLKNNIDVWLEIIMYTNKQQQLILDLDETLLIDLSNKLNINITINLLKNYYKLKSKIPDYYVDIYNAMNKLSFRNKKILIMYYVYDYNQQEISEILSKEKTISQQRISKILEIEIENLTNLLM